MEENSNSMDLLNLQEFDEEALKKESEELLEMRFLNGENAVFSRTAGGFLALKTTGMGEKLSKEYARVGVYLTFPLTNPEEFISIREADEKAKEIGIIEKLSQLPEEQQEMLREQIKLRYFMPVITKVLDVKDEYGYAYWNVVTTFGACRFTTQMSGDAVIHLSDSRLLVTDIDGNRYEIPDFYQLGVMERKKLDLFI
ncbi:MAG: DUF1854 domain-containing protein [Lachnospiraceae bacterium]|jgi:hypothetical protein|nr:DUF1854 domain-containing protein [Lachnospiraceae bacterium]